MVYTLIDVKICEFDHSRNTITYHNALCLSSQICRSIVFSFSWELKWPQEKLKTMFMQNFGMTNKEYYGMLWYFLEWSIASVHSRLRESARAHERQAAKTREARAPSVTRVVISVCLARLLDRQREKRDCS